MLGRPQKKLDREAPLNYSEFSYTKINTPQNIDFDGELSVEEIKFEVSARPVNIPMSIYKS